MFRRANGKATASRPSLGATRGRVARFPVRHPVFAKEHFHRNISDPAGKTGLSTQRWRAFHVINESIRQADDSTGDRLVLSGTAGSNAGGRSAELWLQHRRSYSPTAASGHRSS